MIRLVHTAGMALLVAAALLTYGVKEETRALRAEADALIERRAALEAELATLEAEWAHLNSPEALRATARRLHGEGFFGPEGAALLPWTPERSARLRDLPGGSEDDFVGPAELLARGAGASAGREPSDGLETGDAAAGAARP